MRVSVEARPQNRIMTVGAGLMDEIAFSTITLCGGRPVRIRRLRGGSAVVEGWNGVAWVKGPDATDWADGRPATRQELKALGIRPAA